MRPLLLVAVSLVATACDGRLVRIDSKVSVEPGALQFEPTVAGYARTQPLLLINGSRAPVAVHLSAPAPFELELDVKLAGGEARAVDVTFAPAEPGTFAAVVQLRGEVELDAALGGEAVAAAPCSSASACRLATLDVSTNTCVEANAPDGTACMNANACLAGGQCLAGACLGAAASCDDGDRCTVDACDPEGGCLHTPRACAAPADPCQVARCDAAAGCLTEAATDGTSCGPSDCTTARVCMTGTCRTLSVPDGQACGEASPCRARGRCASGSCAQAAPGPLTEAWHVTLPDAVDFRGVTDPAGNLYWVECLPVRRLNPCELVSYTAAGFPRFRVLMPELTVVLGSRHLWSQSRLVVAGPGGSLTAFSDASGAVLWSRAGDSMRTLLDLAADSAGRVVTLERFAGESEAWSLNELAGATGVLSVSKALAGAPTGLVLDAQDNRYLQLAAPATTPTPIPLTPSLVSYAAGGALRWSIGSTGGPPVAAFNGELLLSTGEVRSTADGTVRPGLKRWAAVNAPAAVMSAAARFRWQDEIGCGDSDFGGGWQYLEGFTPGVHAPRFSWATTAYSPQASEMQLLADGTALFASSMAPLFDTAVPTNEVHLRSTEPSGAERFACLIGPGSSVEGPIRYIGATALTLGRWAVVEKAYCNTCVRDPQPVLRVFSTPGLSVAATGWTGPRGTPGGTGAPR